MYGLFKVIHIPQTQLLTWHFIQFSW